MFTLLVQPIWNWPCAIIFPCICITAASVIWILSVFVFLRWNVLVLPWPFVSENAFYIAREKRRFLIVLSKRSLKPLLLVLNQNKVLKISLSYSKINKHEKKQKRKLKTFCILLIVQCTSSVTILSLPCLLQLKESLYLLRILMHANIYVCMQYVYIVCVIAC